MASSSLRQQLKETIQLAIPIVLSQLGQNCFGLIDTLMIGKLGAAPLSASAFVNNVINIPMIFVLGVSSAVSVLVAQSFGAKNYKDCGRLLNNSLLYVLTLSLLVILGLEALTPFLSAFQQPHEVLTLSYSYYHTIVWSICPYVLFFVLKHFSEGLSHPRAPLIFLCLGLFLNFIFNYLLIYGHFGFPKLGLFGAGLATLISRWAVVIFLFLYIQRSKIYTKFLVLWSDHKLDPITLKNISRIGIPSGFQYLFEVAAFAGCGIMMGWLGTNTLASHQIALQVASLTFMFPLGFSFAASVRIGQLKGELDYPRLRISGFASFGFIIGFQILLGLIILFLRKILPTIFIDDLGVQELASRLLVVAALFQVFDGVQAVGVSILRGLQDVKVPTLATLLSYWIIALPLAYFLAFHAKLYALGIWGALGLGLLISSVFMVSRFHYKTKKLLAEYQEMMGSHE